MAGFSPIMDSDVPVVPIQRTLLFDRIPVISLIAVLFPVPVPLWLEKRNDHQYDMQYFCHQYRIPDVVPC